MSAYMCMQCLSVCVPVCMCVCVGQVQILEQAANKTSVGASEAVSQSYEPHVNQ